MHRQDDGKYTKKNYDYSREPPGGSQRAAVQRLLDRRWALLLYRDEEKSWVVADRTFRGSLFFLVVQVTESAVWRLLEERQKDVVLHASQVRSNPPRRCSPTIVAVLTEQRAVAVVCSQRDCAHLKWVLAWTRFSLSKGATFW